MKKIFILLIFIFVSACGNSGSANPYEDAARRAAEAGEVDQTLNFTKLSENYGLLNRRWVIIGINMQPEAYLVIDIAENGSVNIEARRSNGNVFESEVGRLTNGHGQITSRFEPASRVLPSFASFDFVSDEKGEIYLRTSTRVYRATEANVTR